MPTWWLLCRDENVVAIDLITEHMRMKLQQPDLRRIYHNLELVPSNYQIRGMHTIVRDQNTSKTDFVFYADRLLRLVRLAGRTPDIWHTALWAQPADWLFPAAGGGGWARVPALH